MKFPNPYDAPAQPPLQDYTEMLRIMAEASRIAENPPTEIVNVIYIKTTHQDIEGTDFDVSIDIAPILQQFGDGVYTIHLSASTYTTRDTISDVLRILRSYSARQIRQRRRSITRPLPRDHNDGRPFRYSTAQMGSNIRT